MTDAAVEQKREALRALLIERKRVEQRRAAADGDRVLPVARDGELPLSWQQEGLWFLYAVDRDSATYHLPVVLRLRGGLDVAALSVAMAGLLRRHEGLRSRFGVRDGVAFQSVDEAPPSVSVPVVALPAQGWQDIVDAEARRPFELEREWGLRCWVGELDERDHILMLNAHHLVTDGWSTGIIVRELAALYEAARAGTEAALPAPVVQPGDYAVWQRRRFEAGGWEKGLAYWRERLAALPVLELPADRPRPALPSGAGGQVTAVIPASLAAAAARFAAERSVSPLAVYSAAYFTVLHRYTGQHDLSAGSVFSGRTRSEVEPIVSLFANTVVLRVGVDGDPTFTELADRCNDAVVGALEHQDVPFAAVVDAIRPERIAGRNPLFQTTISLVPGAFGGRLEFGGLAIDPVYVDTGGARFDLSVQLAQAADGSLALSAEYAADLFDRDRVQRLVEHFATVLAAAVADPGKRISALPVMGETETELVTDVFNRSGQDLPLPWHAPVHEVFAAQARRTPQRCALWFDGTELSYRELDARANAVARYLRSAGVLPGSVVGVKLHRSVELLAALLGVFKAGAVYLPLDPDSPPGRLEFQIADAGAATVLTEELIARLDQDPYAAPPPEPVRLSDIAYVIYTSGSTGKPKGVAVSHAGLANKLAWRQAEYGLEPDDVVVHKTPFTFDVSLWELLWPLLIGARLVVAAPGGHHDFRYLAGVLRSQNVTVTHFVPAVLRGFLQEPSAARLPALRRVYCSGEALTPELRDAVFEAWPAVELHNLYGPTEASIEVTAWACSPDDGPSSPIGRPIANLRTYVLDDDLRPMPIGVPGELYLAGTGLALGYVNRPALTAERFVPCPFGAPGERMYRTGDVARWRGDGAVEYLGRNDDQIKIRGLRVELGEIEHVLAEYPGVDAAAVKVAQSEGAEPFLAAYLVGEAADEGALRAFLADRLPLHMVPAVFTVVDTLPLTSSGKLDRKALPDPRYQATHDTGPLSPTEQALAHAWAAVLNLPVERIAAHDNFFALGGGSLDLARLTAAIRDRLGVDLLVRDLYLTPTLSAAAALADSRIAANRAQSAPTYTAHTSGAAPSSSLIPLRSTGSRPPLFLVHAVGGSAVPYIPLARLLDDEQPVYVLEAPGLHGEPAPDTLAELARRYTTLVRSAQPHGPYRLGGWSGGGVIAHEMAVGLREAGEEIALLALFDSVPAARGSAAQYDETGLVMWFAHDLAGLRGGGQLVLDPAPLRTLSPADRLEYVLDRLVQADVVGHSVRDEARARFGVFAATVRAFLAHRPRPLDRPITLLRAAESSTDVSALWRPFAPAGLDEQTVPGSHYTMLQPPHLTQSADRLRHLLDFSYSSH